MSNPLTDVFTAASAPPLTPSQAVATNHHSRLTSTTIPAFSMEPSTWTTRSSIKIQLHQLQSTLVSTLNSLSTHPLLARAASHPAIQQLATKLNVHPHIIVALVLATCALAVSAIVSVKHVLSTVTTLVPMVHSLRALELNDARELKSAVKLWLLYMLTAPTTTTRAKYSHLLARLALLTYRSAHSASIAYSLVIRPLTAAAVKHGVIPHGLATTYLGMDPVHMDVQARSPVDMEDVPVVVQRAVGLVVTARPEVGKYLAVEPGNREDWMIGTATGSEDGRSRVGTGAQSSPAVGAKREAFGHENSDLQVNEMTMVKEDQPPLLHARKTSNGVLGLTSVKLQQQLQSSGQVVFGQQFVDADEPETVVKGSGGSGRSIGGQAM